MARILGATSCHSIQPFPGMARGVPCHLAPLPPPAAHPLGAQILEIAIPSPTEKTKNRRRKARQTGHTQTGHCMPPKRRREDAAEGQGRKTRSRAGTGRRESDSGGAKAHRLRLPKARIRGVPLPTSIHDAGTGSGDGGAEAASVAETSNAQSLDVPRLVPFYKQTLNKLACA